MLQSTCDRFIVFKPGAAGAFFFLNPTQVFIEMRIQRKNDYHIGILKKMLTIRRLFVPIWLFSKT
jgi:hypothetical protein